MNTQKKVFLLPYKCQVVGWFMAGAALLVMIGSFFFGLDDMLLLRFQIYGMLFLYTLYLRTSSALTAMLAICALRLLLSTVFAIFELSGPMEKGIHDVLKDAINGFTGFGSVLFLYLILYKIRLGRYNKEGADEE